MTEKEKKIFECFKLQQEEIGDLGECIKATNKRIDLLVERMEKIERGILSLVSDTGFDRVEALKRKNLIKILDNKEL